MEYTPRNGAVKEPRTKRGWQLAILEQMVMPKGERSKDDRPVKPVELASILRAIDNRARESGWYVRPIEDDDDGEPGLATESHLTLRKCKRGLEVLRSKGWIEPHTIKLRSGARRVHWRIVFQDLVRTTKLPLWQESPSEEREPSAQPVATDFQGSGDQVPKQLPPSAQSDEPSAQLHEPSARAGTPYTCLTVLSAINRPSTAQEWAAAADQFQSRIGSINALAMEFQKRGKSPAEFCAAVNEALATADLPANAGKLTNPRGAVVVFLRTGDWPQGIVSKADQQRQLAEKQAAAERRREAERQRAAEIAQRDAEIAERKKLEARWGAQLDAMDAEAREALAKSAGVKVRTNWKWHRPELLRALDQMQSHELEVAANA